MARDAMVTSGIDDALAHHANLASTVCPVIDTAKFHLIIQVAKHLLALRATRLWSEQFPVIDTPKFRLINEGARRGFILFLGLLRYPRVGLENQAPDGSAVWGPLVFSAISD